MACIVGDVATVEVLLGFNPDLSVRETGGATLLHAAASAGHVGIMQVLLDRGLNPNETDSMGDTPLHWIPSNGSAAAVRLLLDRGADMNAQNSMQYTPILLATLRDNYVGVTTLLSAGARADIDTASWGTPLEASCLGNFPRCTEALLSAGVTATYSWSPLDLCAQRDQPATAEICLKYGLPVSFLFFCIVVIVKFIDKFGLTMVFFVGRWRCIGPGCGHGQFNCDKSYSAALDRRGRYEQ